MVCGGCGARCTVRENDVRMGVSSQCSACASRAKGAKRAADARARRAIEAEERSRREVQELARAQEAAAIQGMQRKRAEDWVRWCERSRVLERRRNGLE